jgi:hypothetical protein
LSAIAYSPTVIFTGDVASVSLRGSVLNASCVPGGTVFDIRVPRFLVQPGCNHRLFSTGCGINQADWTFTATVRNAGTAGWPFTFELESLARVTGPAPTYTADWFAGGWIVLAGKRLPILRSTSPSGGIFTVTLSRDPHPFPVVGQTVNLFPGCDLRRETCAARFNNFANFGGHPFVPLSNPSLVKLSAAAAGGKK